MLFPNACSAHNFIFLSNYLHVRGRQADLPELFEHLQAEPSAAQRWNSRSACLGLSSSCDRRLLAYASWQPKAQLAGAQTAQASPRRHSSWFEASAVAPESL